MKKPLSSEICIDIPIPQVVPAEMNLEAGLFQQLCTPGRDKTSPQKTLPSKVSQSAGESKVRHKVTSRANHKQPRTGPVRRDGPGGVEEAVFSEEDKAHPRI